MNDSRIKELRAKSVEKSLEVVGRYTKPRSYGVYHVANAERPYRFGNHPVRESELRREYGDVALVALFRDREDAHELASLL